MTNTVAHREDGPERPSRASIWAIAFLLCIGVAVPILLGAVMGSLFLPTNDDPAYRRVALNLYSTGRLELNGWNSMTLVGQLFFVQPFLWLSRGADWAFTAATATLASVGIVAAYSLLRRVLSVPLTTVAILGVVVFPGFAANTTTYMTDVPSWAMSLTCLALAAAAFSRTGGRRWVWLAGSLAVGCFAFSIREFAIVAPVTVLAVAAFSGMGRQRGFWVAAALTGLACAAIYFYATHLPGRVGLDIGVPSFTLAALRQTFDSSLRHGVASVCLAALPALLIAIAPRWRRWHLLDALAGCAVASVFVLGSLVQIARSGHMPPVVAGNLIGLGGSLDYRALYGVRPVLFAEPWWGLINGGAILAVLIAGAACGAAIGAFMRSTRRRPEGETRRTFWLSQLRSWTSSPWALIVVFLLLYGIGIAGWSMAYTFFDRYLWPLLLPLYAVLLRPVAASPTDGLPAGSPAGGSDARARLRRLAAPAMALLLVAGSASTSLVLIGNYDAFSNARWQAGSAAVRQGTPPGRIDAGLEWVAFHATGSSARRAAPDFGSGYEAWWPSFQLCELLSSTPISDSRAQLISVDRSAYRLFGFAGRWEPLYLYKVPGPGCP
jgi:hypothetical protein